MAATIAALGERALRRLGVAVVAVADRPALTATVLAATIATQAVQMLGLIVPAAERPSDPITISPTQIATRALQWLGVVASDETPNAEDLTFGIDKQAAIHSGLVAQGIVSWGDNTVPRAVGEDYVMLVALHLAASFGKTADPAQQPVIEARIRRVSTAIRAQALAEARVQAVHEGLIAQGVVSWGVDAIPRAVANDYATLVMVQIAPILGLPGDGNLVPVIEARVRRVALVMGGPLLATQAVLDVHASLDARGKARWSMLDLPDYAEAPYVMLAANLLAPQFALPVDQAAEVRAMRELAQVIAMPSSGAPIRAEYF